MRKLKLQVQISIDGYICGPNGEMDWMTWQMDEKLLQYTAELNRNIEYILLGRKLAEGFIPHWKQEATDEAKKRDFVKDMSGEYDFARKMHETKKIVFSTTLKEHQWEYTTLNNGDLVKEVTNLKEQEGGDIIVYGGASFNASLINAGLIDEFHLYINPAAIGKGMPIFPDRADLKLVKAIPFECGIVVIEYNPK